MKNRSILFCGALFFVATTPADATALLQNGDFSAGLLSWSAYATINGTISDIPNGATAAVTSFDVTGMGAQNALFLNAGIANAPYYGSQQGGGVVQSFTASGGTASFLASIASYSRTGNLAGGIFSVLLDGVVMSSFDFADIGTLATERSNLSFTADLTAGLHTIALQATRPYGPGRGVVAQYFTNVSFDETAAAIPEPANWALMLAGFGLVGGALRSQRKASVRFA